MKLPDAYGGVAILLLVAGLSAQTDRPPVAPSAPSGGTAIITVGCINRAVQTGSLAPAPGVPAATPATAEILANSSEPTNAFLLARATAPNATDQIRARAAAGEPVRTSPTTYVLDGTRQELERHTGHLVEVTGTLRTVSEGDNANRTTVAHVRVTSIKMLASACANPTGEGPK
jgi:hypothetical protein